MKIPLLLVSILLLVAGCSQSKGKNITMDSSQSWAFDKMIIFQNGTYQGTDENVTQIETNVGEIKISSIDENQSVSENFSNYYSVGTRLYKIKGVPIDQAIAVEIQPQVYIKAFKKEKGTK